MDIPCRDKKKVANLINSLTIDEDIRQDLWVEYLSGTPSSKLYSKILKILIKYDILSREKQISNIIHHSIPENFLNTFSDIESKTLYLLCLGYNIGDISDTLGQDRVSILDAVSSIRQKSTWSKNGFKESIQR
jgi:hypothetical protein